MQQWGNGVQVVRALAGGSIALECKHGLWSFNPQCAQRSRRTTAFSGKTGCTRANCQGCCSIVPVAAGATCCWCVKLLPALLLLLLQLLLFLMVHAAVQKVYAVAVAARVQLCSTICRSSACGRRDQAPCTLVNERERLPFLDHKLCRADCSRSRRTRVVRTQRGCVYLRLEALQVAISQCPMFAALVMRMSGFVLCRPSPF